MSCSPAGKQLCESRTVLFLFRLQKAQLCPHLSPSAYLNSQQSGNFVSWPPTQNTPQKAPKKMKHLQFSHILNPGKCFTNTQNHWSLK